MSLLQQYPCSRLWTALDVDKVNDSHLWLSLCRSTNNHTIGRTIQLALTSTRIVQIHYSRTKRNAFQLCLQPNDCKCKNTKKIECGLINTGKKVLEWQLILLCCKSELSIITILRWFSYPLRNHLWYVPVFYIIIRKRQFFLLNFLQSSEPKRTKSVWYLVLSRAG